MKPSEFIASRSAGMADVRSAVARTACVLHGSIRKIPARAILHKLSAFAVAGLSAFKSPENSDEPAGSEDGKNLFSAALLWPVFAISFFINILMLTSPLYMLQVYDRVVSSGSYDTLIFLSLACGGLLLANGLLEGFRSQLTNNLAAAHQSQWAPKILRSLARSSSLKDSKPDQRPLQDLETVQKFMSGNVLLAFLDAPWTPVFLLVLFILHPILGLTAVVGAVILTVLALITELVTSKLYAGAHQLTTNSGVFADDILNNSDVVRSMGMLERMRLRWQDVFEKSAVLQARANDRSAFLRGLAKFFRPLLQMGILGFGAFLVINGELTAGSMVAGSILMGRALAPIEQVVSSWRTVLQARGAWTRLQVYISENVESDTRVMEQPKPQGILAVENLTVLIPGSDKPILQRISFELSAGEALAIVGPSGAGKSTLARALVGAIEPDRGAVRLDGVEMAHWSEEQRGQNIGYLPQDVQLFDGTVADNISRFIEGPDAAVHAAAQLANVSDLVNRLPDGFLTELTEAGKPLSPGQCQRVALARAMYSDPSLIVLDEPNAHLDSDGEAALVDAIAALRERGATIVLITHRSALLNHMDKVLALASGKIRYFDEKSQFLNQLAAVA